jgi:hypothetical protein
VWVQRLAARCPNGEVQRVGRRVAKCVGRGGGAPVDRGVARGEGLGGVGTGHWRDGAQTARGGGWRHVGIAGVAAPLGTGEWCVGRG